MGYLGALAPFIAIWAISRSNLGVPNGRRTVPVMAKGDQLTEGYVGDNGEVIQPTYEEVRVRVEAPLNTLVYQTPTVLQNGIRFKYGVVRHEGFDDGRRTYTYDNGSKNAKIFPETVDGFYAVEWRSDNNRYDSTGIKGWTIRANNRPLTLDEQKAFADMLYEDRVDRSKPQEPQEPSEPELPPEALPPTAPMPDIGDLVGGGLTQFTESDQTDTDVDLDEIEVQVIGEDNETEDEPEEVVVEEEQVEINLDAIQDQLNANNTGSLLGGRRFGGFNV